MTQTLAIFLDAYRELNSRKLFWITLILSVVVVASFALVGINEEGLRLIVWDVPFPLNTKLMSAETFYKTMYVTLGIQIWLAWVATILALVSTASIFPDLITSGSIDLVLSKPISRLRLYLTKYATGLLFVALQVSVFSVASFLVLGFAGDAWVPAVFLAIPLMVVFFSYLFSICALLGLVTRSTIAALMLTLLIWFVIFGVHMGESGFLAMRFLMNQKVEALEAGIARSEEALERLTREPHEGNRDRLERVRKRLDERRTDLTNTRGTVKKFAFAHRIIFGIKTALPKTTETIGLLERWLIDLGDLPLPEDDKKSPAQMLSESGMFTPDQGQLQVETAEAIRSRSVGWVLGTSLAFEAVLLGLGGWLFWRRDF